MEDFLCTLLAYLLPLAVIAFWWIRIYWESFKFTDLYNRPVLITGCDSGFGHDAALEIAKHHMPVFAGCLTPEGMRKIQQEAAQIPGAKLMALPLDVTSDESVEKMAEIVERESERYGGLWAVINSAGVSNGFIIDELLTCDDYRHAMEVNFYGIKRVANRMMKLLKARKGRLVNVTSISGRCPIPGLGPYVVTKHTATAWNDNVRKELSMFGVEVYIIEPGFVKTNLTDADRLARVNWAIYNKAKPELREEYGPEFIRKMIENQKQTVEIMACPNTKRVVDDYVKAVTSVYCRTRMKMGWDSWLVWHLSSFFPTNIQDFYLNNLGFIFGPNIPAALLPHCSHCKLHEKNPEILSEVFHSH